MKLFDSVDLSRRDVLLTRDLLAAGHTDKSIRRATHAGDLVPLRHGAYTTREVWWPADARDRRMLRAHATLRLARAPCVLARDSAADVFGVPVWEPSDQTHIARLDARADRRTPIRTSHRGVLRAEDVTIRNGIPVTSGTCTALDMTTAVDLEHALVTVNGLLHAGETSIELLVRSNAARTHHPHSLRTDLVLRLADGRCASAGESRTFYLCWAFHLPIPQLQYPVRDGRGRVVAWLDFAWPERGVFLEFDGKIKYDALLRPGEQAADVIMREKRREQLTMGLTGWRCIRVTWADLGRPQRTADRIRATLEGRRWAS